MKNLSLFALIIAISSLLLVGCKKADEATDSGTGSTTSKSIDSGKSSTDSSKTDDKEAKSDSDKGSTSVTKEQLVGKWTTSMDQTGEMSMKMEMTVDAAEDNTFAMHASGTFEGNSNGMKISGKINLDQKGTWKLDGNKWTHTPTDTKGNVEDLQVTAEDPKMQSQIDGMKDTLKKTFEEKFSETVKQEHTSEIESISDTEMVTKEAGNTRTWKKG